MANGQALLRSFLACNAYTTAWECHRQCHMLAMGTVLACDTYVL